MVAAISSEILGSNPSIDSFLPWRRCFFCVELSLVLARCVAQMSYRPKTPPAADQPRPQRAEREKIHIIQDTDQGVEERWIQQRSFNINYRLI